MINVAFAYALASHILLDFYLQNDKMAQDKELSDSVLVKHCALYALGIAILVGTVFELGLLGAFTSAAIVFFTHYLIDGPLRSLANNRGMSEAVRFTADQFLHVLVLVVILIVFNASAGCSFQSREARTIIAWALSIMCCGKPAAIAISTILCGARITIKEKSEEHGPKSGRWIGMLERMLVLALSMLGEYSSIAFVFTAKSIARFKEIEQSRDFAEVYLLGTLTSVTIALFSALVAKSLAGI